MPKVTSRAAAASKRSAPKPSRLKTSGRKSLPKGATRKIARKRTGVAGRHAAELERYRLALDNISDGVVLADKNFDLKFANRHFAEFLQIPAEIARPGRSAYDVLRFLARRGDFGPVESEKDVERIVQEPPTAFAQPPCEHEPILAGEANIEQDDSRQFTLDEPAQCRPAVDAGHTQIVFAEVLDQQMALGGLVFDHDDMWPVVRHCDLAPIRTRAKHCRPCAVRQGP